MDRPEQRQEDNAAPHHWRDPRRAAQVTNRKREARMRARRALLTRRSAGPVLRVTTLPCRPALLLDPACTVTSAHERHDIQQGADMAYRIPETFSMGDWSLVTD